MCLFFNYGGHLGGHLGFLGSPSFMPIYAGSFINYKLSRTFWYITLLVAIIVPVHHFLDPDCHPTNMCICIVYYYFADGCISVTFKELMPFITGADMIPPCGFPKKVFSARGQRQQIALCINMFARIISSKKNG